MQHLCAAVGKLTQLGIGCAVNGLGIFDDSGVCHQDAGNIRPVFVDIGIQSGSSKRAGDIGAAAGKGADLAVGHEAVEAGNHDAPVFHQGAQSRIGFLLIHGAVIVEVEPSGGIDKVEAQIVCHQTGGKILAAGNQLLAGNAGLHFFLQPIEIRFQIGAQTELIADLKVTAADGLKNAVIFDAVLHMSEAQIQQVGDFVVIGKALAGRRNHHNAAGRIGTDDIADFPVLGSIRHGGAAEFQSF